MEKIITSNKSMNETLKNNKFIFSLLTIIILVFVLMFPALSSGHMSSWQFHIFLESVSIASSGLVVFILLKSGLPRNSVTYLVLAFSAIALFDSLHLLMSIPAVTVTTPNELASLVPWSWYPGRIFSGMAWIAFALLLNLHKDKKIDLVTGVLILLTTLVLAFAVYHLMSLPTAHEKNSLLSRPQEIFPAFLHILAVVFLFFSSTSFGNSIPRMAIVGALLGTLAQFPMMTFSSTVMDVPFIAAHILKLCSMVVAALLALEIRKKDILSLKDKVSLKTESNHLKLINSALNRFFISAAFLIISIWGLIVMDEINEHEQELVAEIINEVGAQRKLFVTLQLQVELMDKEDSVEGSDNAIAENVLIESLNLFLHRMNTLRNGQLVNVQERSELLDTYRLETDSLTPYLENLRILSNGYQNRDTRFNESRELWLDELRTTLRNTEIGSTLDSAVDEVQFEFQRKLRVVKATRYIIGFSILAMMAFIWRYSVNPMLQRIQKDMETLSVNLSEVNSQVQRFFDLSNDMVCIARVDGYFIRVNKAFCDKLGYSEKELLERPFNDFIHPDDIAGTDEVVEELEQGATIMNFVNRYRHADGHWLTLEWVSRSNPELGEIYAVARDITAQRLKQEKLEKNAIEFERANTELEQFAYIAAHDLRSPLRDVQNLSNWLFEDVIDLLPENSKSHLLKIQDRVSHMERLLDDLLAYSRAARKEHLSWSLASDIVSGVLSVINIPDSFHIEKDIDENLELEVEDIPLQTVIRNLVSNSVNHHHRTDGTIKISVKRQYEGIKISVIDDGPGIPHEYHKKIFQMFQRLQPKHSEDGTGIGLSLIKKITESRGGIISLESEPGKGTAFHVTWPCRTRITNTSNGIV